MFRRFLRGHAPFAALVPDVATAGAYQTLGGFAGVVRDEPGTAYVVRPTAYSGPPRRPPRDEVGYVTREPARRLFALCGAGLLGRDGLVYCPRRRLAVRETVECWDAPADRHPALRRRPGPGERLPGVSLSLGTLGGDGFYHLLLEALPKLAVAGDLLGACDHFLVPGDDAPWRRGWLAAFGVDLGRVRWMTAGCHYRCDQLLFTGRVVRHFEPNPWAVGVLRSVFPPPPRPADGPVLWLDRSGVSNRRVPWEGELRRLVGALPADLGRLSPAEAAAAVGGASAVAGLHGAAFSNMVFARPGLRVVEFQPEPVAPWFARLAQACGHAHLAVPVTADSQADAAAVASAFVSGRAPAG